MARLFKNFEDITMNDFVAFTEGFHVLTITGHKEDVKTNKNGETREVDIFELTNAEGANTMLTLYYMPQALWTYKKLMHCCGANIQKMQGDLNIDMNKLIGKSFGAFVELEEVEKWDENKGVMVTKRYPRINMTKIYTLEEMLSKAESMAKFESKDDMVEEPAIDGDMPF